MSGEPAALELADRLDDVDRTADLGDDCDEWLSAAADMLRRQHGENERLRQVITDLAAIPAAIRDEVPDDRAWRNEVLPEVNIGFIRKDRATRTVTWTFSAADAVEFGEFLETEFYGRDGVADDGRELAKVGRELLAPDDGAAGVSR